MIGGQGEDSCGNSGRPRKEALHGNQLRCHKRFSSCVSFLRLSITFF
ncbi:hypothetical protein [Priestia megaterium]|nr:hypothetical protein [Priestia megaterium]MED4736244.1 hypothetical protein [Priestia megaterium]